MIKKIKNAALCTYLIEDLNGEDIVKAFYEKEVKKTNRMEFRIENVMKKTGDEHNFKRRS